MSLYFKKTGVKFLTLEKRYKKPWWEIKGQHSLLKLWLLESVLFDKLLFCHNIKTYDTLMNYQTIVWKKPDN